MKRRAGLIIITIFILIFTWMYSAIGESSSYAESLWLTEKVVNPILQHLGFLPVDKDMVRKIAHVFEFFLLSLLTSALWRGEPVRNLYTGLTLALLDETIQVFTGRSALVTDI